MNSIENANDSQEHPSISQFSDNRRIILLPVHLTEQEYRDTYKEVQQLGLNITETILPEDTHFIVLANINTRARAEMEIIRRGLNKPGVSLVNLAWIMASKRAGQQLKLDQFTVYKREMSAEYSTDANDVKKRGRPRSKSPKEPDASASKSMSEPNSSNNPQGTSVAEKEPESKSQPERKKKRIDESHLSESEDLPVHMRKYSCQRPHPIICPNEDLVVQLIQIREIRSLQGKEISVRAYSSAIAAIKSYPTKIVKASEVTKLPGCGAKISKLVDEYLKHGEIESELTAANSSEIKTIGTLSDIWGVGPRTARDWYLNKGYRTVDDVKTNAWSSLTKAQKAGVLHYDEFRLKLNRSQVEFIADQISRYAREIDPNVKHVVCGSYRRGKSTTSDIDIVLSVPSEDSSAHRHLLKDLLKSLKKIGLVSDVLTINAFDDPKSKTPLLDVALTVWTTIPDPESSKISHYRVDIITANWKSVGCAIVGWTGGTTFERDLRIFCKNRGLKFTSGGLYERNSNVLIDTSAATIDKAEHRVFEVLGLPYFEPELRNTG
ncbi:hypothetical protein V1511DRAFT_498746 [Dipodascopsis uninucleata]